MATCRNDGVQHTVAFWYLVFLRLVDVVAHIETSHIKGYVGIVVEFNPVIFIHPIVDEDTVSSTHLVHLDRHGNSVYQFFIGGKSLKSSHKGKRTKTGDVVFLIRRKDGTLCVSPTFELEALWSSSFKNDRRE